MRTKFAAKRLNRTLSQSYFENMQPVALFLVPPPLNGQRRDDWTWLWTGQAMLVQQTFFGNVRSSRWIPLDRPCSSFLLSRMAIELDLHLVEPPDEPEMPLLARARPIIGPGVHVGTLEKMDRSRTWRILRLIDIT